MTTELLSFGVHRTMGLFWLGVDFSPALFYLKLLQGRSRRMYTADPATQRRSRPYVAVRLETSGGWATIPASIKSAVQSKGQVMMSVPSRALVAPRAGGRLDLREDHDVSVLLCLPSVSTCIYMHLAGPVKALH